MFNHDDYHAALQAKKDEIRLDEARAGDNMGDPVPGAWRRTVDRRYATFVSRNAVDRIKRGTDLLKQLEQAPWTPDTERAVTGVGQEIVQACSTLHLASSILVGMAKVGDPVGAEATMRLYEEAARPAVAPPNSTDRGLTADEYAKRGYTRTRPESPPYHHVDENGCLWYPPADGLQDGTKTEPYPGYSKPFIGHIPDDDDARAGPPTPRPGPADGVSTEDDPPLDHHGIPILY